MCKDTFQYSELVRQGARKYPSYICKGCYRAEQQYLALVKSRGSVAHEALQARKKSDPSWWAGKIAGLGKHSTEERRVQAQETITEMSREFALRKQNQVTFLSERRIVLPEFCA
jgi:hypothetical protein